MKKLQFLTLIICAWVLSPLITQAQNTYALIVGISQYKEMPALQYADRDAIAFAEFVKGQGSPAENVSLFLNEYATRMNIVDELYRLSRILKPQDRFYFYFGGHGDLEAKIGYENAMLLLHGSFKTGYFQGKEFLQLSELKTWLTALSKTQAQVIFIADACHSGGLIGGSEGKSKTQRALQENWVNVTKILSSQANEYSLEGQQWGGGRGLFSFHLVNGLTGRADVNKNKLVSVKEIDEYLRYHVHREASPNVQTPLVVGESTLALSKSSASGLAQLAEAEKRNFPVISVVNFKGANPIEKMLAKLDTGIVELYKRFSKAVKERRLADHDNAQDNALLHFRAMAGRKIPDTLLNIMKRNLGAALMERELQLMRTIREKGQLRLQMQEKILNPAIANLEETSSLFAEDHYFQNFLQARKLVLKAMLPLPTIAAMEMPIDRTLESAKKQKSDRILLLKRSLELEPNMVSTYIILSEWYRAIENSDSSAYFLEKVIELLPNNASTCLSFGLVYKDLEYKDKEGLPAPHPLAIKYLELALRLDSTQVTPHYILSALYTGSEFEPRYHNFRKAIQLHHRLLNFVEKPIEKLATLDLGHDITQENYFKNSPEKRDFVNQLREYANLEYLYSQIDDSLKSKKFATKLDTYCNAVGTYHAFINAGMEMYFIFDDFNADDQYLSRSLEYMLMAQKSIEHNIKQAKDSNLPILRILNYEVLKAIGATYRNLKKYSSAEQYLSNAMAYSIEDFKANHQLKMLGTFVMFRNDRILVIPHSITEAGSNAYIYSVEPNLEMFFLNLEQNKQAEALQWWEKALKVSVAEKGNDVSGLPYRTAIIQTYKNLDVNAFNTLYEKYFPKTNEKK